MTSGIVNLSGSLPISIHFINLFIHIKLAPNCLFLLLQSLLCSTHRGESYGMHNSKINSFLHKISSCGIPFSHFLSQIPVSYMLVDLDSVYMYCKCGNIFDAHYFISYMYLGHTHPTFMCRWFPGVCNF